MYSQHNRSIEAKEHRKSEVVHKTRGATSSAYSTGATWAGSHRSAFDKVPEPPLVNNLTLPVFRTEHVVAVTVWPPMTVDTSRV